MPKLTHVVRTENQTWQKSSWVCPVTAAPFNPALNSVEQRLRACVTWAEGSFFLWILNFLVRERAGHLMWSGALGLPCLIYRMGPYICPGGLVSFTSYPRGAGERKSLPPSSSASSSLSTVISVLELRCQQPRFQS